ncbi:MAG TPA: MaoC/PaaZ C-terminal domain-containing protein [Ktedonobacterales bacterium]|nr:MaoC/PaaZ C-terminal domain-containing protein [Ktedonobacterales bacterium]
MALYYDDLSIGQMFTSPARTITETDLVSFAMLSGDWNPLHTDTEFAQQTIYGQRVVYGLLGPMIITGLMDRMGLFQGTAMALLGIREWQFKAPIFIGDTIHFEMQIADKRLASAGDRGIVNRKFTLINQRGERVQEGYLDLLIRAKPQQDDRETS